MKQCKNQANNLHITSLILYVDYDRYIDNSMCWKINLDGETGRHAKMSPVSFYRLLQTVWRHLYSPF